MFRVTLQGKMVKIPVRSRCALTGQHFIYSNLRGKPIRMPLKGIVLSRGRYALNSGLLSVATPDGREALLDRYEESLAWFQNALTEHGLSMTQIGEEHWVVQA